MRTLRSILIVGFLLVGLGLIFSSVSLYFEATAAAESPTAPEFSALWGFFIEGGLLPFAPQPENGQAPKPSDVARIVGRGLAVLGATGVFFCIGAVVFAVRGRPSRGA